MTDKRLTLEGVIETALEAASNRHRKIVAANVLKYRVTAEGIPVCTVEVARPLQVAGGVEHLKPLENVPILYPSFGGVTVSGPLNPGDDVLLLVSDRQIGQWLVSGGKYTPTGGDPDSPLTGALALPIRVTTPRAPGAADRQWARISTDSGVGLRFRVDGTSLELEADAEIRLGAAASKAVNRTGDPVSPSLAMSAWATAVETAINILAPGTFTPGINNFAGTVASTFASTGSGSAKVKAE